MWKGKEMKLRNKRTGEMIEGKCLTDIVKKLHERGDVLCYGSLLNVDLFTEYWEEIDSSEPLIKDEKVRRAVYLWALSLGIVKCKCNKKINNGIEVIAFEFLKLASTPRIEFPIWCIHADLTDGRTYTITELCGDENEED